MKKNIARTVYSFLVNFTRLQLFITLISLPILSAWGLSISVMAPVGNLIFTPWITAFLLIASLIFFSELLYIPNGLLITFLDYITYSWLWMTSWGSPTWLIGLPKNLFLFFLILALCACAITIHKKIIRPEQYIMGYTLLIAIACTTLFIYKKYNFVDHTVEYGKKNLSLMQSKGKTCLIDHAALGHKISVDSWLQFTLLPTLNQTCGTHIIDHLVLLKPSIMTFRAVTILAQIASIKKLYLVMWSGENDEQLLRSYGAMRHALNTNETEIIRIGYKNYKIVVSSFASVTLQSQKKNLRYRKITYPEIIIQKHLKEADEPEVIL